MKLLLDEMLSPALAVALRARGHDVVAIRERPDWQGASDPEVISLARAQSRAIVTNNVRDFRPLHAELLAAGGSGHAGFIFVPSTMPRTKAATGQLLAALEAKLAQYPGEGDLADGETWI